MSIRAQVEATIKARRCQGWHAELALSLASKLDEQPNASMARELRALMSEIEAGAAPHGKGTPLDELATRRAAR